MDILHLIHKDQVKFTDELLRRRYGVGVNEIDPELLDELTLKYGYYCIKELTEVIDEVNYKHHKFTRFDIDRNKIKEELIDAFKFWLNLAIIHGFTVEELVQEYFRKSKIVEERLERELKDESSLSGKSVL